MVEVIAIPYSTFKEKINLMKVFNSGGKVSDLGGIIFIEKFIGYDN